VTGRGMQTPVRPNKNFKAGGSWRMSDSVGMSPAQEQGVAPHSNAGERPNICHREVMQCLNKSRFTVPRTN